MSLADELERLQALRTNGTLTEAEFDRAKERVLGGGGGGAAMPGMSALNRLRRSRSDRWIGGVCGGIATASGVDSWICRLVITALGFFGGVGVVIYLLLWVFVPEE